MFEPARAEVFGCACAAGALLSAPASEEKEEGDDASEPPSLEYRKHTARTCTRSFAHASKESCSNELVDGLIAW